MLLCLGKKEFPVVRMQAGNRLMVNPYNAVVFASVLESLHLLLQDTNVARVCARLGWIPLQVRTAVLCCTAPSGPLCPWEL